MTSSLSKPSQYVIPQRTSADGRRARAATVRMRQAEYQLTTWDPPSEAMWAGSGQWLTLPLPRKLANLPAADAFSWRKWGQFIAGQSASTLNQAFATCLHPRPRMDNYRDYAGLFASIRPPAHAASQWRSDLDFAEQRINGCNPMTLTRCLTSPPAELYATADDTLSTLAPGWTVRAALERGRLFACDYSAVRELRDLLPEAVAYSAPTALFFAGEDGRLRPLAIRLFPADHAGPNGAIGPHTGPSSWALAKAHFQMADGAYHEAISHLLETHLVVELIATCAYRHLHPAHPVSQLLGPHFRDNLAIDALARTSLLNKGGPIDNAIGVGARGALRLVSLVWQSWDFQTSQLPDDLARRGLDDREILPFCWYREDAVALHKATSQLTAQLAAVWYADDAAVLADWEVQHWAAEIAAADGGALPGFPSRIETRDVLARLLAEIIFRASAQHAAVNNGQYDRYGWPPYSPTALQRSAVNDEISTGRSITELEF